MNVELILADNCIQLWFAENPTNSLRNIDWGWFRKVGGWVLHYNVILIWREFA